MFLLLPYPLMPRTSASPGLCWGPVHHSALSHGEQARLGKDEVMHSNQPLNHEV